MAEHVSGELVLLGTGTSHGVPVIGCQCPVCQSGDPRNNRTRTGVAIQSPRGTILIDTSPELRIQLLREKISLVHAVLYTHSHADHIFGMDDLRLFGYHLGHAVPLYCEEPVEEHLRRAFPYAFQPPHPELHHGAVPQLEFHRIGEERFDVLGIPVRALRLLHGRLPVLGFRIGNVAFCTDVSEIPDQTWEHLEGLDTLIIDALREKAHATHFGIAEALDVVRKVRPRQTFFTHVSHHLDFEETNRKLPDGVQLSYDGLRIPFAT